jgi:hypothetical protein
VRIFPGIHLNAGLKSMSLSIGGLTIGTKGTRTSVPLGGGFSYSTYTPWRRRRTLAQALPGIATSPPAVRLFFAVLQGLYLVASILVRIALTVGMIGGVMVLICLGAAWDTGRRRPR